MVEILSTDRSHDLVFKRRIYAEAGVREYWIFDPRSDTVIRLELQDGEYAERPTLPAGDTLTTPLLPGLSIPLAVIFHHRRRPPRGRVNSRRVARSTPTYYDCPVIKSQNAILLKGAART